MACLLDSHDRRVGHHRRGGHPNGLAGETPFAKEVTASEHGHHRRFPPFRDHRQLDLSSVNVEHGVRGIPLGEDDLLLPVRGDRSSGAGLRQERLRVELCSRLTPHGGPPSIPYRHRGVLPTSVARQACSPEFQQPGAGTLNRLYLLDGPGLLVSFGAARISRLRLASGLAVVVPFEFPTQADEGPRKLMRVTAVAFDSRGLRRVAYCRWALEVAYESVALPLSYPSVRLILPP